MIKFRQIGKWAKNKGLDAYKSAKHAVSNPKETATKAINYIKSNPDEVLVAGLTGPGAGLMAAHEAKKGNKKEAAVYGAIAAAPIGSGYIVGKKVIKGLLKSKKMSDSEDKSKLSGKNLYKSRAAYIPVTAATYIGGRMLAKKLGAGNITKNYAPLIPAIAAGRLTKKAVVGRLKAKDEEQKEYSMPRLANEAFKIGKLANRSVGRVSNTYTRDSFITAAGKSQRKIRTALEHMNAHSEKQIRRVKGLLADPNNYRPSRVNAFNVAADKRRIKLAENSDKIINEFLTQVKRKQKLSNY